MKRLQLSIARLRACGRALAYAGAVFVLASLVLFLAVQVMPEDPVSLRVKNPDPARIAEIRAGLGLDDPLHVRYLRYCGDFVRLNWGDSLISGRAVRTEVARFLPATIELAMTGMVLGIALALCLVLGAHASGWRALLQPVRAMGALGLTVPIFWIGILLVLLFSVVLGWLPVGGRFDFGSERPELTGFLLLDCAMAGDFGALRIALLHLLLPAFTLALYPAAVVAATLEARLAEPVLQRMVLALHARGFSPLRIWGYHVPRAVIAPVITVIGTQAGALLGGAVLTETVYSWPGMGRFLVDGVLSRDVFVIQNGLLLVVLLTLIVVASADAIAHRLDPNLKQSALDDPR